MRDEWTKDTCIEKYHECKLSKNGVVPDYREFLKYSGIPKLQLARLFGSSAYSRLQSAAGDDPNKLQLERAPMAAIMQQYGQLVIELDGLPTGADWEHRAFKPSVEGLRKKPHRLRWSELPGKFLEWIESNQNSGFENLLRPMRDRACSVARGRGKGRVSCCDSQHAETAEVVAEGRRDGAKRRTAVEQAGLPVSAAVDVIPAGCRTHWIVWR